MKWLLLLAGSVLLLIVAWMLFGPAARPESTGLVLDIPLGEADPARRLKAARQLENYHPTPKDVQEGVQLLQYLLSSLTDEEWPKVAQSIYVGWERIHRTPGSQTLIEPWALSLLEKMGPHLGSAALQGLIEAIQKRDYYAPQLEEALVRAQPLDVTEAAIYAGDYERAAKTVVRVAPGDLPTETRPRAERLAAALKLHSTATLASIKEAVALWAASPEEELSRRVIVDAGVRYALAGKESRDFGKLKKAVFDSSAANGAADYWAEVLKVMVGTKPERSYMETHVLDALMQAHEAAFKRSRFAYEFWLGLADRIKGTTPVEATWQIECLRRASIAAVEDSARLKLADRLVEECRSLRDPARAAAALASIEERLSSQESKGKLTALHAQLAQDAVQRRAAEETNLQNQRRKQAEARLADLKERHKDAKERQLAAATLARMEAEIRALEMQLTE